MANKHFFQPLLPGFHSHVTIPLDFLKNIEGKYENKTAKLRSDASKIIWEVKIDDGHRFTNGWREFALAHDLRIGDSAIFRQEKDLTFHVTLMGPSCCEIQYESCLDEQNNFGDDKTESKKKVKKIPKREAAESTSLDPSCFVANVTPSTLRYDKLNLPKRFVRTNCLVKRSGKIVLINEKGRSWTLDLKLKKSDGTVYINGGWRKFCLDNGVQAGDILTFKLILRGGTMFLCLSPKVIKEEEEEEVVSLSTESESDEDEWISQQRQEKKSTLLWKASSSPPSQNRFVTLTYRPYNVKKCILFLPARFTRTNGINEETKMTLLDKEGVKWSTNLRTESNRLKMVGGWKNFFKASNVMIGESVMLMLIWEEDTSCVLKFCSKVV